MSGGRRESETNSWATPGTLMSVLGFVSLTLSSYWHFRESDRESVSKLENRISVLESRTADLWNDWLSNRRGAAQ